MDATNPQFAAVDNGSETIQAHYEPEVSCLIDRLVPDEGVFVDVGSNWGFFALHLASRPGFRGLTHAYEPHPRSCADLSQLVSALKIEDRVFAHKLALSNREGTSSMSVPDRVSLGMAHLSNQTSDFEVRVSTLDLQKLQRVDFIKIDVEQHEIEVIEGARTTLQVQKPWLIFENFFSQSQPQSSMRPFALLDELDYRFCYPSWSAADAKLTLLPLNHPMDRARLPYQVNVFAYPSVRTEAMCLALRG